MFSPEAFFPVLARVASILDQYEIRFHLTGGLASVHYAEPRLTQDADFVVEPVQLRARLDEFIQTLQRLRFVADVATIRDAAGRGRMFQIFDSQESLKVDLYPRELVPGELGRSVMVDVLPELRLPFASRPDLVLSKLVWISKGSHKSRRDVRQLMLRANEAETKLVRELTDQMSLQGLLQEVLGESDEIDA